MSSSFRSILQQVTEEKLEELKIQRHLLNTHFQPILLEIAKTKTPTETLNILYTGVKESPVKDAFEPILIENLKHVLQNSRQDQSLSCQLISAWTARLQQEIHFALRKCEYSYLYGSLLTEWLEIEDKPQEGKSIVKETETSGSDKGESKTSLDKISEGKDNAIERIRKLMFTEPTAEEFEAEKFRKFLSNELFDFGENVEAEQILKEIIKETAEFFKIGDEVITNYNVQCCITGLTSDELMSPEKKSALKELRENSEALEEVASLLTNRLGRISLWEWPVSVSDRVAEVRRGLAGEYKAFLAEDILTALFLQYVGVRWAAYFKRQFLRIFQSKAWIKSDFRHCSIEQVRSQFYSRAFLSALPDSMESQENKLQDEYVRVEAHMPACEPEFFMQQQRQQPQYAPTSPLFVGQQTHTFGLKQPNYAPTAPVPIPQEPKEIDFKQAFLHVLSTEIRLNQTLRPENPLIVVQTEIDSLEPSLIHEAVLIALENLGMSQEWVSFFKKFLQPTIKFGANENAETVKRGVPSAHVISSLFGETMLFLLDFLINRKCSGMKLYRISDEIWYWTHKLEDATNAWSQLSTYGKMMGLKVNQNRSGSATVYSDVEIGKLGNNLPQTVVTTICGPSPLPKKRIHWGYLELHSNGIFKIDKEAITKFLTEMKELLSKSSCVLEWINIFNKYLDFFVRNFGQTAVVSGIQHLDQIIESLRIIYNGIFGSNDTSPVEILKERYPLLKEADIIDAWVYWPLERGGLGLVNPFVPIMAIRETYVDNNDEDYFQKLPLQDKMIWNDLKKQHEAHHGVIKQQPQVFGQGIQVFPVKFPTWEEYVEKRETELKHWRARYEQMLNRLEPKSPLISSVFWNLDIPVPEDPLEKNYIMWIYSYYETQLRLHFGSVKFINSKLLPMSMIASIQKSKVKH